MSRIRSLKMTDNKIMIGEYSADMEREQRAEILIQQNYPELMVITSTEGKKQVPLQDLIALDERIRSEMQVTYVKGHEEGDKEGYQRGLHEGREEARQVVASLSGVLSDITNQRHVVLADAKERILEIILKISKRLTFSAAEIDPSVTMSIITGTIEQLLDKRSIKVKVHPDHLAELEQHIDKFMGNNTTIKEFIIEPDSRIRVGGCFIETPAGDIDARLESMYEVIKQAILEDEDITF
ncbi:MAG: hypothetical protein KAR42_12920 [candidate division Zixibacteria bacterium]|nr:hypothetical protein [candidate division Zixibacteria bacterium]